MKYKMHMRFTVVREVEVEAFNEDHAKSLAEALTLTYEGHDMDLVDWEVVSDTIEKVKED